MNDQTTKPAPYSVDTNTMLWEQHYVEQLKTGFPIKGLMLDPETGVSIAKIRYRAGFTNVWHRHNCAHGMYVLDGILQTHAGSFGPGSFVWFPEGMEMQHGATQDNDVTLLFITNKPLDVRYTHEDQTEEQKQSLAKDAFS